MKVHASALRMLMGEGEALIAAVRCLVALDAVQLKRSPVELEQTFRHLPGPVRDRLADAVQSEFRPGEGLLDGGLAGLVSGLGEKMVGGGARDADEVTGNCAFRLAAAFEEDASRYCVVSDRRLIIAAWSLSRVDQPHDPGRPTVSFRELASVPRAAVLRVRRRGTFLHVGRVEVDFRDLSRLVLLTGHLATRGARRLVTALTESAPRT